MYIKIGASCTSTGYFLTNLSPGLGRKGCYYILYCRIHPCYLTSANIIPNFTFERSAHQVMRASCSKIPNSMLSVDNCSHVSTLFIYDQYIILLYTLKLPNTSFPSGFEISGATDYPHTRPEKHRHVTRTPKRVSVRLDAKNTVSSTVGSVEQTSFFLSGLGAPDCGSIPRSPASRTQQLHFLRSRLANDTIAVTRTATRQSSDKNYATAV
jgi:hypothetical protein